MKDGNTFIATTPDGDTIQVIKDGDHLSRSYQTFSPKLQKTENALSFLENPAYADIPLADMQEGLRKTLGYSLYEKLNVRNTTDRASLITLFKTNVVEYQQELSEAKRGYEKAMQKAVAENKKHNAEADEKIKTTLRAIKNSGLEFLDIDHLISNTVRTSTLLLRIFENHSEKLKTQQSILSTFIALLTKC